MNRGNEMELLIDGFFDEALLFDWIDFFVRNERCLLFFLHNIHDVSQMDRARANPISMACPLEFVGVNTYSRICWLHSVSLVESQSLTSQRLDYLINEHSFFILFFRFFIYIEYRTLNCFKDGALPP